MRHRPRPPPVRPAQVRVARRRARMMAADGEYTAHFLSEQTAYYFNLLRIAGDGLAKVRGKLYIADRQLDTIYARWGIRRPLSSARGPRPGTVIRQQRRLRRYARRERAAIGRSTTHG